MSEPEGGAGKTILVIIDEPKQFKYGGEIAAPAFSRMAQQILNYLHVTPDILIEKPLNDLKETKINLSRSGQPG